GACSGCQAVRHADRAIAALLHGGQSQDGSIARRFSVGCVRRPGQRGARMRRREFITLLGGVAAWPIGARAQQGAKISRIGIVDDAPRWQSFRQALRELGYVGRQTVNYEYRPREGGPDRPATVGGGLILRPGG